MSAIALGLLYSLGARYKRCESLTATVLGLSRTYLVQEEAACSLPSVPTPAEAPGYEAGVSDLEQEPICRRTLSASDPGLSNSTLPFQMPHSIFTMKILLAFGTVGITHAGTMPPEAVDENHGADHVAAHPRWEFFPCDLRFRKAASTMSPFKQVLPVQCGPSVAA
jgi:hypothetical protein